MFYCVINKLCIESFALCCVYPAVCPSGIKITSKLIYCIAVRDIDDGNITVIHEASLSLEFNAGEFLGEEQGSRCSWNPRRGPNLPPAIPFLHSQPKLNSGWFTTALQIAGSRDQL